MDLFTGLPGSGKSYLAVHQLLNDYFVFDKNTKKYTRKEKNQKYKIFTNINGFVLDHKNLNEIFESVPFDQFFSYEYQQKIHEKYPNIIYVIDEIHDYIPPYYKNESVMKYFSKHRHFGDRVWIITQDSEMTYRKLIKLVELEYRAVQSTFRIPGRFIYNIKSKGEIFKRKNIKINKKLFKLYISFKNDDQVKHSNPIKYYIIIMLVAFISLGFLFFNMLTPSAEEIEQVTNKTTSSLKEKKIASNNENYTRKFIQKKIHERRDNGLKKNLPIIYEITSKVIVNDKLFGFVCPLTSEWFEPHQSPYKIQKYKNSFYISVTPTRLNEIKQILSLRYTKTQKSKTSPPT